MVEGGVIDAGEEGGTGGGGLGGGVGKRENRMDKGEGSALVNGHHQHHSTTSPHVSTSRNTPWTEPDARVP